MGINMELTVKKKPLAYKAMQYKADNILELMAWSNGQVWAKEDGTLVIRCIEAIAESPIGTYVVMGIHGEVWPVREDIFNDTYDIVNLSDDAQN